MVSIRETGIPIRSLFCLPSFRFERRESTLPVLRPPSLPQIALVTRRGWDSGRGRSGFGAARLWEACGGWLVADGQRGG